MKNLLCSQLYRDFCYKLQGNASSLEEANKLVVSAIKPLADAMHVGRMEVSIENRPEFTTFRESRAFSIYSSQSYSLKPETIEYPTNDNGKVVFKVYPLHDETFSEEEMENVNFLCSALFFFYSHSRLSDFARRASTTDLLTGAANQNSLRDFAVRLEQQNLLKNYVGIFINLKNFKYVNQTLTPRNGDLVLKTFTQQVMRFCEDGENFARLGGDNFFALIQKQNVDKFISNFAVYEVSDIPGIPTKVKLVLRMGLYSADEKDSISVLLNCSSIALNVAKYVLFKNVVWFEQNMLESELGRREISVVFPEALKNEEFAVYYQPKVDSKTNLLCGCEALVRWFRNGRRIMPMEFLPVLEQDGTICLLDFYVFDRACRNIRQWLDLGYEPVRVSTNFSRMHLKNPNFAHEILDVLNRYKVPAKYLEVELTEVSDVEDNMAFAKFVDEIRASGIKVSVDDFGSGYSTFNVIKNLKIDVVKLDKSLFSNLEASRDSAIVRNLVAMLRDLNFEIVAEGIETEDQLQFMKDCNCNYIQGFYYDQPLPYVEFTKRLGNKEFYKN